MNKTVTANISGIVFHIETDAYEKLHVYLNTIKTYFNKADGSEEIMADIEARIAELFKEKLGNSSDVITMVEVKQVIEIMGEPEQYLDEDSTEDYSQSNYNQESYSRNSNWKSKKLFRDEEGGNIGGVCSGLGYYFGIDSIWIKAAFLIAVFGFGTGILLYLILWIIMPAARTTSEKLEMRGEPINVQNIGNSIKEEFNSFKKKVEGKEGGRNFVKKTEGGLYRFFDLFGKLVVFLLTFIVKVIGVVFIITALSGLILFITFLVGGPFDFSVNNNDFSHFWTTNIAEIFFSSKTMFYTGFIGLSIVLTLPLLGMLYGGAKLLFNIPSSNKIINLSAISLLIIGVIMISVSATTTAAEYSNEQHQTEKIELTNLTSDTILLSSNEMTYNSYQFGLDELFIENNNIFTEELRVNIVKNYTNKVELKLDKTARGRSRKDASKRSENISIDYTLDGNEIKISPLITIPFSDGYRDQEVKLSLAIPVGKTVFLAPSSADVIYDIKNVSNMYDLDMIGHHWKMTEQGLKCTDCLTDEDHNEDYLKMSKLERLEKLNLKVVDEDLNLEITI